MLPSFGRLFVAWLKEGLAAVLRPFVLFPLLVLNAVEAILQLLGRVKGGEREERPRSRCTKVPEPIKRKPDPCLYSQPYLRSLGLAVQWNNPDIWLTDHSGALVDPTQLQRDTDYVVNVRIWNASFDPALATEVRCEYRFHSVITLPRPGKPLSKLLKYAPVELAADGTELVVLLDILPWGNQIARFNWHTPPDMAYPPFFQMRAECRHPDDMNPNNNVGYENMSVLWGGPGDTVSSRAAIASNPSPEERLRIELDSYQIPLRQVTLHLETRVIRLLRRKPFDRLRGLLLTYDAARAKLISYGRRGPLFKRYRYKGWEAVRSANAHGQFQTPAAWRLAVDGRPVENGSCWLKTGREKQREIEISAAIPLDSELGRQQVLNCTMLSPGGEVIGGCSIAIGIVGGRDSKK